MEVILYNYFFYGEVFKTPETLMMRKVQSQYYKFFFIFALIVHSNELLIQI